MNPIQKDFAFSIWFSLCTIVAMLLGSRESTAILFAVFNILFCLHSIYFFRKRKRPRPFLVNGNFKEGKHEDCC